MSFSASLLLMTLLKDKQSRRRKKFGPSFIENKSQVLSKNNIIFGQCYEIGFKLKSRFENSELVLLLLLYTQVSFYTIYCVKNSGLFIFLFKYANFQQKNFFDILASFRVRFLTLSRRFKTKAIRGQKNTFLSCEKQSQLLFLARFQREKYYLCNTQKFFRISIRVRKRTTVHFTLPLPHRIVQCHPILSFPFYIGKKRL